MGCHSNRLVRGQVSGRPSSQLKPLFAAMIACGVLPCSGAMAATITVTDGGDAGTGSTCTLRQAIESANTNIAVGSCLAGDAGLDTVSLLGRSGTITLVGGQIAVTESLTINGPGAAQLAISGGNAGRVFDLVDSGQADTVFTTLSIDGLTVRDGRVTDENGGCIRAQNTSQEGLLVLTNSIVSGCTATSTAGAYTTGAGGGIYGDGNNTSDKYTTPAVLLQNSTVSGNHAGTMGGGIFAYSLRLESSVVSGNTVDGVTIGQDTGKYTAAGGGAAGLFSIINNSTLSGNRVAASAAPASSNAINSGALGGGLFAVLALIQNSTISQNSVFGPSAAQGATNAMIAGGGLVAEGGGFIVNSTISGNLATGQPMSGTGGATTNSVSGGGLWMGQKYSGTALYNSTVAGNTVTSSDAAGATNTLGPAGLAWIISSGGSSPAMYSSIVANSSGGSDVGCLQIPALTACTTPLAIGGDHNLVRSVDATVTLPPDTLSANPMLAPLANHGGTVAGAPGAPDTGPVQTQPLSAGSPAVDAGSITAAPPFGPLTYDQRGMGFPRVVGAAADIGAFEGNVAGPAPTPIPTLGPLALALLSTLLGLLGFPRRLRRDESGPPA